MQHTTAGRIVASRRSALASSLIGLALLAGLFVAMPRGFLRRQEADQRSSQQVAPPVAWHPAEAGAYFEQNRGQAPAPALYVVHGPGYDLRLDPSGVWLQAVSDGTGGDKKKSTAIRVTWNDNAAASEPTAEEPLADRANYLLGETEGRWLQVPTFRRIRYRDVVPGIDVLFSSDGRYVESSLVIKPHADPAALNIRVEGTDQLDADGSRQVSGNAGYDTTRTLVINPMLMRGQQR